MLLLFKFVFEFELLGSKSVGTFLGELGPLFFLANAVGFYFCSVVFQEFFFVETLGHRHHGVLFGHSIDEHFEVFHVVAEGEGVLTHFSFDDHLVVDILLGQVHIILLHHFDQ